MREFTVYYKVDGELFNKHVKADCEYDARMWTVPTNGVCHCVVEGFQPLFK